MLSSGSKFGHYRIEELLGEGGTGEVYKAVDTLLDRIVALKLISRKLARQENYRNRLAAETKIAAKIDSPHVVKIWEHAEHDGVPYLSLEYVTGSALPDVASQFDFDQKVEITQQIAGGIKAAHEAGLIHRDLKPDNIRISADNRVKIFDFGMARVVGADTVDREGNIEGTLHYFSPEQVSGDELTFASDLFSFGSIIFELFTGERPFEGDFAASIVYSILHEDPPDPTEINAELPDWISAMILKLLAKQPAERFESMQAVIEHIQSSLVGLTTAVTQETAKGKMSVTVVDIKNLSGDENWNYFCIGFTEDVINEISRRADLIVTAQPATAAPRDIRECFKRYRTDFVIIGSLMKWQDSIRLNLSIYSEDGDKLVFGENYQAPSQDLFQLLTNAARDASISLAEATGASSIDVDDYLKTDVSAYEYYLKGKTYYHTSKEEDLKHAISMFNRALEIDPQLALAHSGLADAYAFQYAAYYDRTAEKIAMAQEKAKQAIEIDPNSPASHRSLGRCYMFLGQNDEAEKAFLKSIEINPKYAIGYRTLAWLKEMEGDHDQATRWAKRALELAPTDLETLLLLSLVNMDLKKYTLAMATLQRAIELGPDYGRAYYELGTVYLKLGVTDPALENFLTAIKYKGDPNCFLEAGFIYLVKGEYDNAVKKFQESIDEGYLDFIAYYFLGYIEKQRNNLMESVAYFNKSIDAGEKHNQEVGAPSPYVAAYRAMAYAGIEDIDSARDLLGQLEQQGDHNGEVLYNMARIYALLGDASKTQEYIDKAVKSHAGPTEKEVKLDPHFAFLTD